jgi:hypothetical protein
LQDLIINHYHYSKITELAVDIINDEQVGMVLMNYLDSTYKALEEDNKGTEPFSDVHLFEDKTDFLKHVKGACEHLIQFEEINSKEDDREQ